MGAPLYESSLASLKRIGRGKVRDIYAVGEDRMLIVVSDRLSAFDVVLPDPITDKGRVLNEMAAFWFGKLGHIVPNQLTGIDPETVVQGEAALHRTVDPDSKPSEKNGHSLNTYSPACQVAKNT